MKIHFVCTGNVYRSRLGEAYLRSKKLPDVEVTSSGILAKLEYFNNGPISWESMRLIQNNNLIPFMSNMSTQTTLAILQEQDLIIFMHSNHHEFSKETLGFLGDNFEIWEVADLDDLPGYEQFTDADIIQASEKTFEEIKEKVNTLVEKLQNTN